MIGWYWKRLVAAEPGELAWRSARALSVPLDLAAYCGFSASSVPTASLHDDYPVRVHNGGAAIERFRVFDKEFPADFDFDWHTDYSTGKRAPGRFVATLSTRSFESIGDVKYIWEINRHQHLSALAYSANAEAATPYIIRSLDRWLDQNPFLSGINWSSSLELAIRIISWSLIYPRISTHLRDDHQFRTRWLGAFYAHLKRIRARLSRYSSANNHLIGELTGLYVGARCLPLWKECDRWAEEAKAALEREAVAQISPDGPNREQAMSYHLFTLELLLVALAISRRVGDHWSSPFETRLRAMLDYVDTVTTATGDMPEYGDADDARGAVLSSTDTLLATTTQLGAMLFAEPKWFRFTKHLTAAARALVPGAAMAPPPSSEAKVAILRDAGQAVVDTRDRRMKLVMDFGALGYLGLAAHGHADALSIWLAVDDEYLLVDAGTYSYHSHPAWRDYFRGTSAHNTARVDGQDQSVSGGRFLWSHKAVATLCEVIDSGDRMAIVAEHNGYNRLADPVTHRRRVELERTLGAVQIVDRLECRGEHEVELFFHLHEDAAVTSVEAGSARFKWRKRTVAFSGHGRPFEWTVLRGSENPPLGWRSRAFHRKVPISTLRIAGRISGTTELVTSIEVRDSPGGSVS